MSQLLMLAATPILTRIYSPESFGIYAVFFSTLTLLTLFGSGRYEHAIVLQNTNRDVFAVVDLIVILSISITVFFAFTFGLLLFLGIDLEKMGYSLPYNYFFFIPLLIILLSINSGLTYVLLKERHYRYSSYVVLGQSVLTILLSIFLGYLNNDVSGLIIGFFFGNLFSFILLLYFSSYYKNFQKNTLGYTLGLAKRYINFPKFLLLSDLSASAVQYMTPILLISVYDSFLIGNYSMATRFLRLPTLIIATSLTAVFRNDFAVVFNQGLKFSQKYKFYLTRLVVFGLLFFLLLYFISPFIFTYMLGDKWNLVGDIAQLLIVMIFFEFISIPFNSIYNFYNKQHLLMSFQLLNVFITFCILYILPRNSFKFNTVLVVYSLSTTFFNLLSLVYLNKLTTSRPPLVNVH